MFGLSKKMSSVFGRMPAGYGPCYRCTACRTCLGTGKAEGKQCGACAACPKCDGNRVVPIEKAPVEDAEAIISRFNILKRPMLEHVAFFLRDQPEGNVVFERLFEKRLFQLANGKLVRIKLEHVEADARGKGDVEFEPNVEDAADDPVEVPSEVPA